MKTISVVALLLGAVSISAQKCGLGTTYDEATDTCVAILKCGLDTKYDAATGTCVTVGYQIRDTRATEPAKIVSKDGNMVFRVKKGQQVGVQVGDDEESTQYLETANSTVGAVVNAIKLGYEMNREIDQIKDIQKAKDDLNAAITQSAKEGADARVTLQKEVEKSQTLAQASLDSKISQQEASLDSKIQQQEDDIKASLDAASASLDKFKKDNEQLIKNNAAAVTGLKDAVPAFTCKNGKKDGDETDVDCGGDCEPCAKNKKCAYSSDCDKSVCVKGVCKTCSSGDGTVTVSLGKNAVCKGGYLQPATDQPVLRFDTCGKTGEAPPGESDCKYRHSLKPKWFTLQQDVQYNEGFQRFVAPIDGVYEWTVMGAAGGTDVTCCRTYRTEWNRHGKGGDGGRVVASHDVKAGTVFYIAAGQRGYDCYPSTGSHNPANQQYKHCVYNPSGHSHWDNGKQWWDPAATHNGFNACGGFNGGGPAICNHDPGGASGGGASDVRMCKQGEDCGGVLPGLDKRILVGGGGGGGSCEGNGAHGCGGSGRWGGHGGGDTGENGYSQGWSGYGGTQTAGGKGQWGNNRDHGNSPGVLGQGGTGGQNDAGGGGGGFYGGGGAHHNSGGGGGSNFRSGTSASGRMSTRRNDRAANRYEGYVTLRIKG